MKFFRHVIYSFVVLTGLVSCTFSPANKAMPGDSASVAMPDTFGRPIESTSINIPVKKYGELLLEFNTLDLTIRVYKEPNIDSVIQKLGPIESEADFTEESFLNDPYLIFNPEDLNFDGYMDIKIPTVAETGASMWYNVFLFDPKKKKFIVSEELSLLTSLQCDSISKRLHSLDISGIAGNYYTYNTYRWKGKKLQLELSERQDGTFESPDMFIRMVLKMRPDSLMDTLAILRIWKEPERERWCLEKGDWRALEGTPFPGENVVKMDGRDGGCQQ